MAEEKGAPVEVLTPEEMAQLHPIEQAMHDSIMAQLRKSHGDAWISRNRDTIRTQISQVTGVRLD